MAGIKELLALPLAELKARFFAQEATLPKGLLAALENDGRQGARALAQRLRARQQSDQAETQRLRSLLKYEKELWTKGFALIAGVDEAGVGPLAGPVIAGAVILPNHYQLRGLKDSKQLAESVRIELAAQIKRDAIAWAVGAATVEEIDRLNVYHASLLAMQRAVTDLLTAPDFVLVDGRRTLRVETPQRGIVRGDAQSASIAAASIIAKTTRDALMLELDQQYPGYGLAAHKGYPTPEHFRTLRERGALPIHRRSCRPVREVLGLEQST
jgi:ribonuclease HII